MTIVDRVYWDIPKVYCYNPVTGEFTVELECDPYLGHPGQYLKPECCTTDIPKETGPYQKNKINSDMVWEVVPDYRGVPLYDKETKEISYIAFLGADCPLTHTPSTPPSFDDWIVWKDNKGWEISKNKFLKHKKETKKSLFKDKFSEEFTKPHRSVSLNVDVDLRRDAKNNDLQNYQALRAYMAATSTGITYIRLYDNSTIGPITIQQLDVLILELIEHGISMYNKKWNKEADIDACTTTDQVDLIVWES